MSSPNPFRLVRRRDGELAPEHASLRSQLTARKLPKGIRDFKTAAPNFKLDAGLETAINMAIAVGSPLLLTGEPGTGKTQVAYFLEWYFGIPLYEFQVKSTSTAEHLRYDFDAVGYMREAMHPDDPKNKLPRKHFLTPRALWLAFESSSPCVLLIDEIDKAPRDFPNDLLQELDKHCFKHPFEERYIPDVGAERKPPIVVITSNGERPLPDAFRRRCIFHHLELTKELVREIAAARVGDFPHLATETVEAAVRRFFELRENSRLAKRPSTAELLAWLAVLSVRGTNLLEIDKVPLRELPCLGALLKDKDDPRQL